MMNVVVLVGRLVADPQLRQTQQGTAVASFRVAVDRSFAGPNGQRQADFIDLSLIPISEPTRQAEN